MAYNLPLKVFTFHYELLRIVIYSFAIYLLSRNRKQFLNSGFVTEITFNIKANKIVKSHNTFVIYLLFKSLACPAVYR